MDMYLKENLSKLAAARNGNKEQRTRTSVQRMTKTKQKLMRIDYANHACAHLRIITAFFRPQNGQFVVRTVHTLILIAIPSFFFLLSFCPYTKRPSKKKNTTKEE